MGSFLRIENSPEAPELIGSQLLLWPAVRSVHSLQSDWSSQWILHTTTAVAQSSLDVGDLTSASLLLLRQRMLLPWDKCCASATSKSNYLDVHEVFFVAVLLCSFLCG